MKLLKYIFLSSILITAMPTILLAAPIIITVTNTNDSGAGSLRAAIAASEANNPGVGFFNTIDFAIPTTDPNYRPATDSFLIQPTTFDATTGAAYRIANYAVKIDGYSQVGNNGPATPATTTTSAILKIEIRGPGVGLPTKGFFTSVDNCVFQGLCINSFLGSPLASSSQRTGVGIQLSATACSILGNYLGIDITGTSISDNGTGLTNRISIFASSGSGHFIGDGSPAGRNIIGASNINAILMGSGGSSSFINGNYIGTNAAGNQVFNLTAEGVLLLSAGNILENNLISGIAGYFAVEISNRNNTVMNNKIGTDVSGTLALGNNLGILVTTNVRNADNAVIQSNLISGTQFSAIHVGFPIGTDIFLHNTTIDSNKIGVDITGSKVLGNGQNGIFVPHALNTIITGNTIAASEQNGIFISELSNGSIITNNFIGTDSSGMLSKDAAGNSFGNGLDGVHIGINQCPANNTQVGNVVSPNTIGNNLGNGITIESQSSDNTVQGNFIGANKNNKVLPNQKAGVLINCASNNTIGS